MMRYDEISGDGIGEEKIHFDGVRYATIGHDKIPVMIIGLYPQSHHVTLLKASQNSDPKSHISCDMSKAPFACREHSIQNSLLPRKYNKYIQYTIYQQFIFKAMGTRHLLVYVSTNYMHTTISFIKVEHGCSCADH